MRQADARTNRGVPGLAMKGSSPFAAVRRRSHDLPAGTIGGGSTADNSAATAGAEAVLVRAWWMFCNVAIHALWGLYPVSARWLQTRPGEAVS